MEPAAAAQRKAEPMNKYIKKSNRRFTMSLLTALLITAVTFAMTGCSSSASESGPEISSDGKPSIVCTAFPQYDWTLNILGDRASEFNVTLLNHQGADMHSFQPTAENMVSIAKCDLFIHIGGYSESWVPSALESAGNEKAEILTLLDYVDAKAEEFTEGMEHNHDHDHGESAAGTLSHEADVHSDADEHLGADDHDDHDDHDDNDDEELDEHMWLSLRCAQDACDAILKSICKLDPENALIYEKNALTYSEKLQTIDKSYEYAVSHASKNVLLFADRFPFRYLTDDYNLEYLAAFPGCSAETEASFETILYLSEEMEAHQLTCAIILEGSKTDFAKTVIGNAKVENPRILTLNSMQSINQRDIDAGTCYLTIMEENLAVLKEALA